MNAESSRTYGFLVITMNGTLGSKARSFIPPRGMSDMEKVRVGICTSSSVIRYGLPLSLINSRFQVVQPFFGYKAHKESTAVLCFNAKVNLTSLPSIEYRKLQVDHPLWSSAFPGDCCTKYTGNRLLFLFYRKCSRLMHDLGVSTLQSHKTDWTQPCTVVQQLQ